MAHKGPGIIQSGLRRTTKIFASGARLAARELGSQLSGGASVATRLKQAQDLVGTLGELKGAAMKAGQFLSIEAGQYLPPEIVAVLRQLQDQVSFMPHDQVRFILQRQLGRDKFEAIEDLSVEPIAAASIGQVHKATIAGKPVAIKIQYPGVANSIDSDLNALRKLLMAGIRIMGKNVDIDPVLEEIGKSLKQEVNYRIEADMIDLVRRTITSPNFVIPEVYRNYSTESVITLSFEDGIKIADWVRSSTDQKERDHVAALILELLIIEVLATGVVQTDPNFANFLYRPSDRKLVLLDFGATQIYDAELRLHLQSMIVSLFDGEIDQVMHGMRARGYISTKESEATSAALRRALEIVKDAAAPEMQPLSLGDPQLFQRLQESAQSLGLAIEHTSPPRELVMIGRKFAGMLSFLREIGSDIDVVQVKQRLAAVKI